MWNVGVVLSDFVMLCYVTVMLRSKFGSICLVTVKIWSFNREWAVPTFVPIHKQLYSIIFTVNFFGMFLQRVMALFVVFNITFVWGRALVSDFTHFRTV